MKARTITRLALGLALALGAAPLASHAEHCLGGEIFVISGVDAGERAGVNHGFYGCTADPNDESLNTNWLIGTHAWAARFNDLQLPDIATFEFNGVTTELTWTNNDTRGRWESQSIALPPAVTGKAVVTYTWIEDEYSISVTYTRVA